MIVIQIFIILLLYSMEGILQSNFAPFTCINIGDDANKDLRVLNDLNLDCNGKDNKIWLILFFIISNFNRKFGFALPILLIFGLLCPLIIVIILRKNIIDNRLKFPSVRF